MSGQAVAGGLAVAVAVAVGLAFVAMARTDLQTSRVVVRHAQLTTALAIGGLGIIGLAQRAVFLVLQASAGALLVTGIQLLPYWYQQRAGGERIGRADVRLAVPFGWTLGWFGLDIVVLGFAVALVAGLIYGTASGRSRIPFIPFMAAGLWAGLAWAVTASTVLR